MATETIERIHQETSGDTVQEKKPSFAAKLEVLNDDQYPAERVISAFCEVLPGYGKIKAFKMMLHIHSHGVGVVWQGPREICELYEEQLLARGLRAQIA